MQDDPHELVEVCFRSQNYLLFICACPFSMHQCGVITCQVTKIASLQLCRNNNFTKLIILIPKRLK